MAEGGGSRTELMGCPFDPVRMPEAIARGLEWCRGERRPHTIVTANAAMLVSMRRDPALAHACRSADLIVADGLPVVWASRIAAAALPERVAGIDLMARLLEAASARHLGVFFLGAREEVVRALADQCAVRHPGLTVAGWRNGYFPRSSDVEVVDLVRRSGADMLFVGMPTPLKETWCERYREALGVPLIMGVGGSFDVLAGFIPRAPRWMQGLGLEWLWRLSREPRRLWKRYLVTNTLFVASTFAGALRRRRERRAARAGAAAARRSSAPPEARAAVRAGPASSRRA